ncbi:MAG TPA: mechanosensitive ion channel family protein [Thermoanaerobaculia bacterium]|nr:mechanosensitive ion channel family protein [Thermoanaerobaculia bacterium]
MNALLYGNTLVAYLTSLAIAGGVLLIAVVARSVILHRFGGERAGQSPFGDFGLRLARRTKLLLLVLPAVYLGARALTLAPELAGLLDRLATLSLIAQGALWGSGVIDFWLRRYERTRAEVEPHAVTTINAFRLALISGIWGVAVLSAFANLGFNITALITGLGIGGVAVALALQNILGDIFASLSIVLDKPFVVGDFIIVGETLGSVEHIGLKTTRLRALSGEQIAVPNGDLVKSRIRNFKRMWERRVVFKVGVVYQTPAAVLERIPSMIREIIEGIEETRVDRVHFMNFADSSLEFESVYYVLSPDYLTYANIQHAVNLGIVRAFEKEGIEFAYPTRTLYVSNAAQPGKEG